MSFLPMTKIALRNLFTKPATRRYPFVVRAPFEATRAALEIDFKECIFCGACSRHCPANAILVNRADSLWRLDSLACVSCGACVRACPKKCLFLTNVRPKVIRARNKQMSFHEHCAKKEVSDA